MTPEWIERVGIMNDYVSIPYANGSSFASQFLYRELESRGHQVTVVGPADPDATAKTLPPRHVSLASLPLRNHPGVHLPMPSRRGLAELANQKFDLVLGQTCTALMDVGVWLRQIQRIPLVLVNTVHLPSVYNTLLPEALNRSEQVHSLFQSRLIPWVEGQTVDIYNRGDGLIVLSPGLKTYWRDRGVTVPIHVIGRAVEPKIFDRPAGADPYPSGAQKGGRLLVVCRHVREKSVSRLLKTFARYVSPRHPEASLTLVGDGPDHEQFISEAAKLGIEERTFFVGEQSQTDIMEYYAHGDLFVYTSLSETYGQVVTEALWCGMPVVAFHDGMGVSGQIASGEDGELIDPSRGQDSDEEFGSKVAALLGDVARRQSFAAEAKRRARLRANPEMCIQRYYEAFEEARMHLGQAGPKGSQSSRSKEPSASKLKPLVPLARMAGLHSLVLALGLIRPPARVNRNGSATPSWTLSV
ncbi:MAG: glycosyltransferase [Myxococcota bacterium]